MEEVNLVPNSITFVEHDPTENQLLELSLDFRNRMNEKNKIIYELKKSLIFCYGITMSLDEYEDISFISVLKEHLEKQIEKHLNLEPPLFT